jgi:hypothetical protein
MANVLTSFLVGIGWDTSDFDKGTRDIERSLNGVKVSTLAVSAAILGVFAGVASAAVNTAQRVDQLALATNNLNTNKQFVANLGGALKLMGGDAAAALAEVRGIETALTNLQLKGEIGPFSELAMAGVDITRLTDKKTVEGFLSTLSEQMPGLNKNQRQLVQESLGLSDATMRSLEKGPQAFEALLQRSQDLTGTIGQLTDNSRALSDQMAEFGLRMQGITNELTEKTLPGLVRFSTWTNRFIEEHRDDISGVVDTVADNPGSAAALGGGALATTLGALTSKLGLKTVGGAASKAGTVGMIVGGATLATDILFDTLENNFPSLKSTEESVDKAAREMGLGKAVDFSNWLFNTESGPSDAPSWHNRQQSADYAPDAMPSPYKDVTRTQEDNDALVRAIQTAKVNVSNELNVNVSLDGQALESKITEVQERSNYSTIDDVRSSTAR